MNKTALPVALFTALTSGCIVYDDKCPNTGFGDDDAWGDTGGLEVEAPEFWLTPAEGAPGETLILSLQADQVVDFAAIEDLTFTAGVTPCTTQARDDELLVTVYVEEGAEVGFVDLLVDGGSDRWFVEDAFFVLGADDGGDGGDGSDGGDGGDGSDGGGGSDGSDGSGGSSGGCG